MNYEKSKTDAAEETEILSADDLKLRQMLGGLKKAEAPKNFDFRLKARIAGVKPQPFRQPVFASFLRYALPLSVIVLLAGFVFINFPLFSGNQDAPQSASNFQPTENQIAPPTAAVLPLPIEPPLTLASAANANVNIKEKRSVSEVADLPKKPIQAAAKYVAVKNNPPRRRNEKTENNLKNKGGSLDITSRDAPPIYEINRNPDAAKADPPSISQHKMTLREVLSEIGIEAGYVEGKWVIVSVNGLAKRSGLQAGDIIEAIDGKKPSSDETFLKRFNAGRFEITRDGKPTIIVLSGK